jgi:hypothetical protein
MEVSGQLHVPATLTPGTPVLQLLWNKKSLQIKTYKYYFLGEMSITFTSNNICHVAK